MISHLLCFILGMIAARFLDWLWQGHDDWDDG